MADSCGPAVFLGGGVGEREREREREGENVEMEKKPPTGRESEERTDKEARWCPLRHPLAVSLRRPLTAPTDRPGIHSLDR